MGYDKLVERCGAKGTNAAGLGFSYEIDKIREFTNTNHLFVPVVTNAHFRKKICTNCTNL